MYSKIETRSAQIIQSISGLVLGKQQQIKLALACLYADGHLLIEDLPGMGKTTLSHALASAVGLSYGRVQFTSDLLPSDITGVNILKRDTHQFEFHPGPIFNQVVLADEINRSNPKTQSALLEAMAEKQVTVDGKTHPLSAPFFVIATQNPQSQFGTYPLPESQLDRFLMSICLGYPNTEAEYTLLKNSSELKLPTQKFEQLNVITPAELLDIQKSVRNIHASDELIHYVIALAQRTRVTADYAFALSPRATQALLTAAKAWAFIHAREYVVADDVKAVFASVCEHRLAPNSSLNMGQSISEALLEQVDVIR